MRLGGCALILAALLPQAVAAADAPDLSRTPDEAARIAVVTAPATDFTRAEPFEARPGGSATSLARVTADAFSQASANISFAGELDFKLGNGLFERLWVSAPSSTIASDGLGPLYNARGCQSCHLKDGRGHPPEGTGDDAVSMLVRISVPAAPSDLPANLAAIEGYLADLPDPVYGGQIQDFGIAGQTAEARVAVTYAEQEVALSEGETARLRRPTITLAEPGYGPFDPALMLSPRVAPPMIGLGLLEAIPDADILARADPDDRDGDGISGRPNTVWSEVHHQPMLGRFGLKAGQATLRDQNAAAFAGDIGISTELHPNGWGDCTDAQPECRAAPTGGQVAQGGLEADATVLDLVTYYSRNLAVPARRDFDDPQVLRGKQVFYDIGCAACHTPKFVTQRLAGQPEQSFQLIWPYSDLLLHDMGDGLADNRPEATASGQEWRTPPLWGIGLTETVSGHSFFLHDGRARTLLEAVLWHGGEAQAARDRVAALPAADRAALIRFLESL